MAAIAANQLEELARIFFRGRFAVAPVFDHGAGTGLAHADDAALSPRQFLAAIVDVFSRRIVGWALAEHLRTELALEALGMALGMRQPDEGLVHHSDRVCQYASAL